MLEIVTLRPIVRQYYGKGLQGAFTNGSNEAKRLAVEDHKFHLLMEGKLPETFIITSL